MRSTFLSMLSMIAVLSGRCPAAEAKAEEKSLPISIALAIPAGRQGEKEVDYSAGPTVIHVVVTNVSDKPLRLWQDWCSWGYGALTFVFGGEDGRTWTGRPEQLMVFCRNYADWWNLAPHESIVMCANLDDAINWAAFPRPVSGSEETVTLKAVLKYKPDKESWRHNVWTGSVESKTERVTFTGWDPEKKKK